MNGSSESSPSSSGSSEAVLEAQPSQAPLQEDMEVGSGNEASDNCSPGQGSDSDDTKDLGLLSGTPDTHQSPDAFSLMMAKSEHNQSGSGCSSEQSDKADLHKELIKTLKELKVHLPTDKRAKGRPSTLATLKYALRSMKQVKANEEYFQLLVSSDSHLSGLAVPSYTLDEVESMTSEYMVKNADMFAVAVSLVTGRVLYISNQVASIFHCKRAAFTGAKFVEFLAPHDVSVFHSATTPYKLPLWGTCSGTDSFTRDCMEEKSFFCRVSVRKTHEDEVHYHPFRMTPYLLKVREPQGPESQLCCVLLAEKVHSGYEAPRIPPEKRIFTTTHTPNCLFQEVDERAVPLLGYLPQDLVEKPVLLQLHPSDRPLMLAIHRKILQSGGQPFDYSPIRFRVQNGEYITLDTSWSSFVNPWSRKISFIMGRYRVRVGPLNEDVFAAPPGMEKSPHPSVQELTEQIHRLLLQPVPHSGSSGYGSLGSNGSHEHLMSQTSSSDSNGHEDAGQQVAEMCRNSTEAQTRSHRSRASREQKRKPAAEPQSQPPAPVTPVLASDKDGPGSGVPKAAFSEELACRAQPACSYQQMSCLDSVIRYLESCSEPTTLKRKCEFPASIPALNPSDKRKATGGAASQVHTALLKSKVDGPAEVSAHLPPLALPHKADSVMSLTSQCSYSSTIVHVGDKKLQPEPGPWGQASASGPESLDSPAGPALSLGPEKEPFKKVGLTKEVLAVHTQKEEQSFLHKFKEMRKLGVLPSRCHHCLPQGPPSERATAGLRNTPGSHPSWKKPGKNRNLKSKWAKSRDSSGSTASGGPAPARVPLAGLSATPWSPSDTSQSSCTAPPFPGPMPAYPLPMFPVPGPVAAPSTPHTGYSVPVGPQADVAVTAPLAPVMAYVLPGYPFPTVAPSLSQPYFPGQTPFLSHPETMFTPQPIFSTRTPLPAQPCACPWPERAATPATPSSATGPVGRTSPPLFESRGSSPLQLNLLQLEETPEGSAAAMGTAGATAVGPDAKPAAAQDPPAQARLTVRVPSEAQHSDALSTSSDLLDLLLHEDLCSAAGSALSGSGASAASDSLGSGSLGCTASGSGTGSSDTGHTSKYFGSIDSSENQRRARTGAGVGEPGRPLQGTLQDPIWLLLADVDKSTMMTYQMPARDPAAVLKEDREKLRALQRFQPQFSEAQKQELREVHPWVHAGGLPMVMDVQECVYCENQGKGGIYVPYEDDLPTVALGEDKDPREEENGRALGRADGGQT
ncbi:PREDICTED: period circadian protein homolog 2 [Elephantulus edwardii]|uniref:period circadian protein homolog 2 n=1 Tax=Elephantulus edwardii TaxID=28737 RepID=UPI0003F0788B|nr:PREDICTED: period circadian protein homolog 2 [Elephantulus edwardii]